MPSSHQHIIIMLSINMERIPAYTRKLTWNCCRKLLEAKKQVECMGSALSLTRVS
ncbi:hypothetical protein Hdeb2414_s0009g00306861 [Helianthus debilis subsp. tardiflorus]